LLGEPLGVLVVVLLELGLSLVVALLWGLGKLSRVGGARRVELRVVLVGGTIRRGWALYRGVVLCGVRHRRVELGLVVVGHLVVSSVVVLGRWWRKLNGRDLPELGRWLCGVLGVVGRVLVVLLWITLVISLVKLLALPTGHLSCCGQEVREKK